MGDGAIIGANALVSRNVAAYTIVGGNPAKTIRQRYEPEQIEKLLQIRWWDIRHIPYLLKKCSGKTIDEQIAIMEAYKKRING